MCATTADVTHVCQMHVTKKSTDKEEIQNVAKCFDRTVIVLVFSQCTREDKLSGDLNQDLILLGLSP